MPQTTGFGVAIATSRRIRTAPSDRPSKILLSPRKGSVLSTRSTELQRIRACGELQDTASALCGTLGIAQRTARTAIFTKRRTCSERELAERKGFEPGYSRLTGHDRTRSPAAVSQQREYFKYPPETFGFRAENDRNQRHLILSTGLPGRGGRIQTSELGKEVRSANQGQLCP
jgi:hypothetical protein